MCSSHPFRYLTRHFDQVRMRQLLVLLQVRTKTFPLEIVHYYVGSRRITSRVVPVLNADDGWMFMLAALQIVERLGLVEDLVHFPLEVGGEQEFDRYLALAPE